MSDFFSRLVSSREGCFLDPGTTKIEASFMCHEVRSVELAPNEKVWVSVRDVSVREREKIGAIGEAITLRSLQLHTTLLVRVYAAAAHADIAVDDMADRRPCGEVSVPLNRLVSRLNGCLYHTWLTVDSPGLRDSIMSTGMVASGEHEYELFDQAISNGARQLFQPKVCLSIMRGSRLPPGGKLVLADDTPNELRVENWAALLRSQQQHVVMCKALSMQGSPTASQDLVRAQTELALLQNQLEMSRSEMERRLQEQAQEMEISFSQKTVDMDKLQAKLAEVHAQKSSDVEQLQAKVVELQAKGPEAVKQQQNKVNELQRELVIVSEEANSKIDAANERIREIKRERDEALQALQAERGHRTSMEATVAEVGQRHQQGTEEVSQLRGENDRNQREIDRLRQEKATLADKQRQAVESIEQLRREKEELADKHRQATDKINELEHALHEKALELSKAQSQVVGLEGTIKVKHEQTVSASATTASREAEIKEMRSRDSQQSVQIEQLKAKIEQLESNSRAVQQSADDSEEKVASLKQAAERSKQDVTVLREKLEQVSVEANGKIDDANERIRQLRREREDALQENDRLCAEQAKLTASFKAESSQFECLNASLRAQLQELKDQQGCSVQNQDDTGEVVSLRLQCAQQKDELAALKQDLDEAQVVAERSKAQMKSSAGNSADQVREVTRERDDARLEVQRMRAERQQLLDTQASMEEERAALEEQKDALSKIVEDLHHSMTKSATDDPALKKSMESLERFAKQPRESFGYAGPSPRML